MSIRINIPLESLSEVTVARAMAELMLALGRVGVATPFQQSEETSALSSQPSLPTAELLAPQSFEAQPQRRRRTKPVRVKPVEGDTHAERFENFVKGLPLRSRQFIDLVRKRGQITMTEAMELLEVTVPKTMGGITGSIGRWAPLRGIPIPYEASTNEDGERVWTWTLQGFDETETEAPRPTVRHDTKSAPAIQEEPKPKKRGRKPKVKPADIPQQAAKEEQSTLGLETPSNELSEPAHELFKDPQYAQFLGDMRDLSRQFLLLLSEKGELTMTEALETFGLSRANAMGGVIGPLKRRARDYGLEVPFEANTTENGERIWKWVNPKRSDSETAPQEENLTGVRKRRKGTRKATPV